MAYKMKRFAMGVSALFVAVSGIVIAGPCLYNTPIITLLVIMLCWAGIEFYIGFFRPIEGIVPSHPLIAIARMLWVLFVIYSWFDFRLGWTKINVPSWALIILLSACSIGLLIRVWAVIHLGSSFTYDVKCPEGKVLVQTGPYRFIRHPSYLGICLLAPLPGLVLGSVLGFIGLAFTTVAQTILRILVEERILETEFGETFLEYKRKTYSLLPFVY